MATTTISKKVLAFLLTTLAIVLQHGRSCTAFNPKPSTSLASRPSSATPLPVPTIPSDRRSTTTRAFHPQRMTTLQTPPFSSSSSFSYDSIDWTAFLVKYPIGLAGQLLLLFGLFTGIDALLALPSSPLTTKVPFAINVVFLYMFNVKSSLFSLLPNSPREQRKLQLEDGQREQRKVASWTPPGLAFVLGWPVLTFGLRAITGAMIVAASGGRYATPALLSLMLHLVVGDLWNTVYV